ncbi:MAG TPA: PRC-barrel domain-containing protein [Crenalkalicoccus sp.]|nr:PRC-barrel domain-containing protein [Crenalkalicoccus sp.]
MAKSWLTPAVVLVMAAVALSPPPPVRAQAVDLVVVDIAAVARGYRASKLTGSTVYNDKDERIGSLDDLIVGRDQPRVLFAILQVGGFLGLGGHLVAVPFENLKINDSDGKITLPGASRDQLKRLPEFAYRAA